MAAPQGALSASTPETTDGARLEEHIARHALKDSERRSKLLKKARGKVDTRITSWPARQVERADQDPIARETDAPMRFEDLEEVEIPAQEEQSQSTPIPKASDARGVNRPHGRNNGDSYHRFGPPRGRADEALTETPPRDADEVCLEAGEDERMANYEPTDTEDEEIALLQLIMNFCNRRCQRGHHCSRRGDMQVSPRTWRH